VLFSSTFVDIWIPTNRSRCDIRNRLEARREILIYVVRQGNDNKNQAWNSDLRSVGNAAE